MSFIPTPPTPAAEPQRADKRRIHPRRRLDRLAYVDFGPDNGGMLIDISEGGLSFQGVGPVRPHQPLHLRFTLPGLAGKPIEATGELVWSNNTGKGGGLQFREITDEARNRLQQWISMDGPAATNTGRARGFNIFAPITMVAADEKKSGDRSVPETGVKKNAGDPAELKPSHSDDERTQELSASAVTEHRVAEPYAAGPRATDSHAPGPHVAEAGDVGVRAAASATPDAASAISAIATLGAESAIAAAGAVAAAPTAATESAGTPAALSDVIAAAPQAKDDPASVNTLGNPLGAEDLCSGEDWASVEARDEVQSTAADPAFPFVSARDISPEVSAEVSPEVSPDVSIGGPADLPRPIPDIAASTVPGAEIFAGLQAQPGVDNLSRTASSIASSTDSQDASQTAPRTALPAEKELQAHPADAPERAPETKLAPDTQAVTQAGTEPVATPLLPVRAELAPRTELPAGGGQHSQDANAALPPELPGRAPQDISRLAAALATIQQAKANPAKPQLVPSAKLPSILDLNASAAPDVVAADVTAPNAPASRVVAPNAVPPNVVANVVAVPAPVTPSRITAARAAQPTQDAPPRMSPRQMSPHIVPAQATPRPATPVQPVQSAAPQIRPLQNAASITGSRASQAPAPEASIAAAGVSPAAMVSPAAAEFLAGAAASSAASAPAVGSDFGDRFGFKGRTAGVTTDGLLDGEARRYSIGASAAILLGSAVLAVLLAVAGVHLWSSAPPNANSAGKVKAASTSNGSVGQPFQVQVVGANNKRWVLIGGNAAAMAINTPRVGIPAAQAQRAEPRADLTNDSGGNAGGADRQNFTDVDRQNFATTFQPLPMRQPHASQAASATSDVPEPTVTAGVPSGFISIDTGPAAPIRPADPPPVAAAAIPAPAPASAFPSASGAPAGNAASPAAATAAGPALGGPAAAGPANTVAAVKPTAAIPPAPSGFQPPVLIQHVQPAYPMLAREHQTEGDVLVRVTIGKDGVPRLLQVIRGETVLSAAALAIIPQWRYRPALLNGQPVESQTVVTVSFHLNH